jgi:hypothetical protein
MQRKDLFDLTDRIIVVTGGLGQIGRQFALEFIDREPGWRSSTAGFPRPRRWQKSSRWNPGGWPSLR